MNRSLFTQYSVYIFWRGLSLWCCSVMLTLLWGGKALLGGVRWVDKTNTLLSRAGPMFGLVFIGSTCPTIHDVDRDQENMVTLRSKWTDEATTTLVFYFFMISAFKTKWKFITMISPLTVFWSVFIGDILRCLLVHTHITDRQQQWVMEAENNIFVMITE